MPLCITCRCWEPKYSILLIRSELNLAIPCNDNASAALLMHLNAITGDEPVTSVSFSPDGKIIASASEQKVKLWSLDGSLLTTFERFGSQNVSFSPDDKSIASGGDKVSVWNFDLNELVKRGCDVAHDYLKNNSKAESDRSLCDDIYKK